MTTEPEHAQRPCQAQGRQRVAIIERPVNGRAHIVKLGLESGRPAFVFAPHNTGIEQVSEADKELQMPLPHLLALTGFQEFVARVLANRL